MCLVKRVRERDAKFLGGCGADQRQKTRGQEEAGDCERKESMLDLAAGRTNGEACADGRVPFLERPAGVPPTLLGVAQPLALLVGLVVVVIALAAPLPAGVIPFIEDDLAPELRHAVVVSRLPAAGRRVLAERGARRVGRRRRRRRTEARPRELRFVAAGRRLLGCVVRVLQRGEVGLRGRHGFVRDLGTVGRCDLTGGANR